MLCSFALVILELSDFAFEFLLDLFCDLLLVVQFVSDVFVEEVSRLRQHFVAKLLSDYFPLRSFGTLLNEVLQEVDNFVRKRVKSVILVVSQLLGDTLIILL